MFPLVCDALDFSPVAPPINLVSLRRREAPMGA